MGSILYLISENTMIKGEPYERCIIRLACSLFLSLYIMYILCMLCEVIAISDVGNDITFWLRPIRVMILAVTFAFGASYLTS